MADPAGRDVPDPARSYERARPEAESGQGRLDNNQATPTDDPDRLEQAVKQGGAQGKSGHAHPRTVNDEEVVDQSKSADPARPQTDHSMNEEEPTDPDFAPPDIHNPRHKRHPRTEGKGGTP